MVRDVRWAMEVEDRTLWRHRLFCLAYIIGYPAFSIYGYLNGDEGFLITLYLRLICSLILTVLFIFHLRREIDGRRVSFVSDIIVIVFHSIFMALSDQESYTLMNAEMTMSVIFVIAATRWSLNQSIIITASVLILYPIALLIKSEDALFYFLRDGGVFQILANILFPFVVSIRIRADYNDFLIRNGLVQENEVLKKKYLDVIQDTRDKAEFLSLMSHEIRTALNGVIGSVYFLQQKVSHNDSNKGLVDTLQFSSEQLMAIVNDILDYGKIDSNQVKLNSQPFDFRQLMCNIKSTLEHKVSDKVELIFTIDERLPDIVIGDPFRLSQIITNLLNNAIRFTSIGFVRLSAVMIKSEEDGVNIHFEISDSGEGIPFEDQDKVFLLYHQSNAASDKGTGGTGLGLAITQQLLELFDSKIYLESALGKGSTFSFDIYFTLSELAVVSAKKRSIDSESNLAGKRILVVEDNKINLMITTLLLNQKNIEYDTAINGIEAIAKFRKGKYDVILMDLQMPKMGGLEATEKIRMLDGNVCIIALSAAAFKEEQEFALSHGFSDYLVKPFFPEDLYRKMSRGVNMST